MNDTPPLDKTSPEPTKTPATKRQPKPVPETLSEFLLAKSASATRFVQAAGTRPSPADGDLDRSHQIIVTHPEKMMRVVELARAAARALPQPGAILRWCEQVLRSSDDALRDWALDPNQDANAALGDLLKWAHDLHKRDPSKKQRAQSSVLLGFNLLFARRSLTPLEGLRLIATKSTEHSETRPAVTQRRAGKLLSRASYKQLFDFAQVVGLSEAEMSSTEEALRRAEAKANNLRHEKETVEAEADALRNKLEDVNQSLAERDKQIADLVADLNDARTRALQDLGALKARFRRQIGDHLAGLLGDAWDAIDTNPPHPEVTRERLEIARTTIQKELEWLDRSSD